MGSISKIWIKAKRNDEKSLKVALRLVDLLEKKGFKVYLDPRIVKQTEKYADRVLDEKSVSNKNIDLITVVGGDGTLLRLFHDLSNGMPLLLCINVDSIGFLYDYDYHDIDRVIDMLVKGGFSVKRRKVGEVFLSKKGKKEKLYFLNEVAVFNRDFFNILKFKVYLEDELLYKGRADAIVVATTTGASAYALSSNGPVIDPDLECFVITPVAPFSALLKPVVVSPRKKIRIVPEDNAIAIIDGYIKIFIKSGSEVKISASDRYLSFITGECRKTFSEKLTNRLLDKPWSFKLG
ncbi:MAG: hypothetical protein DRJ64_03575 [Thermoprotei archaeon]|nr:MAG: hypothetical protein DRJ64_03575 [Thermoprotei archaeon]